MATGRRTSRTNERAPLYGYRAYDPAERPSFGGEQEEGSRRSGSTTDRARSRRPSMTTASSRASPSFDASRSSASSSRSAASSSRGASSTPQRRSGGGLLYNVPVSLSNPSSSSTIASRSSGPRRGGCGCDDPTRGAPVSAPEGDAWGGNGRRSLDVPIGVVRWIVPACRVDS